jgi:hypothetical protein
MWICMCDLTKIQRYLQIKIKMDLVRSQFAVGAHTVNTDQGVTQHCLSFHLSTHETATPWFTCI